jgi:hypothetical protein
MDHRTHNQIVSFINREAVHDTGRKIYLLA